MSTGDVVFRNILQIDSFGLAAAHILLREYQAELGIDLGFQGFDEELASLPGKYGPPTGMLTVAFYGNDEVGCGALRDLGSGIAELKRVYVRPQSRKSGLGADISNHLINAARELGYSKVRLDTFSWMEQAVRLYRRLGFVEISPYYDNPLPDAVFMEKQL